ncbi:twin-arginine translocase TatA/TatE family subunit [Streptomyces spongiicola]|uniref:Sec-independent protein translocase protein TatA n=1 Tax=Streptomyces spongiicola TaxID=1690221 RepID=A0ABM6V6S6_9ACTN|nr:Sec-independent protein translocase subunit TatA [Streptomyces spongiicola]AWK09701.1 twin-arginine translocase TatA/TatE family subunit [Streptomyces spongiicola]
MFRNALEPWHLVILVAVAFALFGAKRLPDTARALGKSLRILKSEARAMKDDGAGPPRSPEPGTVPRLSAPDGGGDDVAAAPGGPAPVGQNAGEKGVGGKGVGGRGFREGAR